MKNPIVILSDLKTKTDISFSKEDVDENLIDRTIYGCMNDFYSSTIPLDNVSHSVSNIRYEGNNVVGDIHIMKTMPSGMVLSSLDNQNIEFETNMVFTCNVKDNIATDINVIAINLTPKK